MQLKLNAPGKIEASYRIVTPIFIGDANQKPITISPASFKGALRFWWRAAQWTTIRQRFDSDKAALENLHQEEADIFGCATDGRMRQAKASIQLKHDAVVMHKDDPALSHWHTKDKSGIQYLLGIGLYRHGEGIQRASLGIKTGKNKPAFVEVCIHYRSISSAQQNQLLHACRLLGCLGGLGSRARRGFGSISIQTLGLNGLKQAVPTQISELRQLVSPHDKITANPPFSAFSKHSRIDASLRGSESLELLNTTGKELQLHRSWGRDGMVCGVRAEARFKDDHDMMYDASLGGHLKTIPRRSIFGLPHNYFFSKTKKKLDVTPSNKNRTRRASPLFIHIHQFPDDEDSIAIQTLLPSEFLPINTEFKINSSSHLVFRPEMVDWQVIHEYLDRFQSRVSLL